MTFEPVNEIPLRETDAPQEQALHGDEAPDHFVEREGERYAGAHLLLDFWGASYLDRLDVIDEAMRRASEAAGATLLSVKLHHFTPVQGVSGVAVLAESHISIHTWPEREFAAIDIFMCGATEPDRAVEVLRDRLQPSRVGRSDFKRGILP